MAKVVEDLIVGLDAQFPRQAVVDVMGIVYPQYWLETNTNVTFPRHLEVLNFFYCNPHPCGQPKDDKFVPMVVIIISSWDLNVQQSLLKFTMKSNNIQTMVEVLTFAFDKVNPTIINPFTHMW